MKENKKSKQSLTKSLTFKLALLLVAALLILTICAYFVVTSIVYTQTLSYNKTLADNFLDAICAYASDDKAPVDENYTETITDICELLCKRNYAAFAFSYVVDKDMNHIKVLGVCEKENVGLLDMLPENIIGKELEYPPNEDELELWENKRDYVHYMDEFIDGAVVTACIKQDDFGNGIVVGIGVSTDEMDKDIANDFNPILVVILGTFIILTLSIYFIIRKSVLVPAKKISDFMTAYIKDGTRSKEKLDERSSYEFSIISSSFNQMTENIDQYLEDIKELNDAQASQKAELDIASRIQQGFLAPETFYAKNCEIFAKMTPARNVGGDLYDHFVLDDGRILLTIADVSGKGIAAALYMVVSLVVMRQLALDGDSPADILRETNNIISLKNKQLLFITAFIGIYDPETGEFTYSNAGHLPPYLMRNKPEILSGAQNIVLGLYENEEYKEDKIKLDPGDIIFLYTDGVTEAVNDRKEFFGEKRLKETLDNFRPSHEENIVEYVDRAVSGFVKDAESHDDITMLSCTMKQRTVLDLPPDKKEFDRIKQVILESKLPRQLQLSLCVAAEEIYINICSYAFEGKSPEDEKNIKFTFEHSDRMLMRFEDNGMEYDPTEGVQLDADYDPDNQLGGLGKIIAFTIADKVSYEYIDGKNVLTIIKYLMEG